jgi:FG-GAP repeat protein
VAGGVGLYVFPGPVRQSTYFTLSGPGPGFGRSLGIADVNVDGFPDLVVITGDLYSGSETTAKALIFSGIVHAGDTYTNQLLPAAGYAYSWASPNFDVGGMLAGGAVFVGTPTASCSGAAQLFTSPFSLTTTPNYFFEPPAVQSNYMGYGYGLAVAPGYPFVLIGAKGPSGCRHHDTCRSGICVQEKLGEHLG